MWLDGKLDAINDYCLCDTLDTYLIFLRSRVLAGALTLDAEQAIIRRTKEWVRDQTATYSAPRGIRHALGRVDALAVIRSPGMSYSESLGSCH